MRQLQYPLDFKFKMTTLSSDFNITDANGAYVAYVRQKLFKLKEDVNVFSDETRTKRLFNIKANQWIDFNASYQLSNNEGVIGRLARKGMRSFWKATYLVLGKSNEELFKITEENAWTKFLDSFIGELPIIGLFTGYFFNPSYVVKDKNERILFRLRKMPSLFGRRFQLDKLIDIPDEEEELVVLSLLMMVLLERARG